MTIMVRVKVSYREGVEQVFNNKLTLLVSLLSTLESEGIFRPLSLDIWQDAPAEALGGKPISVGQDVSKITPLGIRNMIRGLIKGQPLYRIIVTIDGVLYSKEREFSAYITLYNEPRLRRIYGDIEFDIYGDSPELDSLVDLYFQDDLLREKLISICRHIGTSSPRPDKVLLVTSPDAWIDVRERVVTFQTKPQEFITDLIRCIRWIATKGEGPEVREYKKFNSLIRPYREDRFAKYLWGIPEFRSLFRSMAEEAEMYCELTHSILLASKTPQSSTRLFESFINNIIDPLSQRITNEERLIKELENVVKSRIYRPL